MKTFINKYRVSYYYRKATVKMSLYLYVEAINSIQAEQKAFDELEKCYGLQLANDHTVTQIKQL